MINTEIEIKDLSITTRKDFPFYKNHPEMTYLDSAATSLTPQSVIEAISGYYNNYSVNIHRGVYKLSMAATDIFESVREKVKRFLQAPDDFEVIFLRGTTEALNLLATSFERTDMQLSSFSDAWDRGYSKDDVIILSESEHHSNIVPWQITAMKSGVEIIYIPVDHKGALDLTEFEKIRDRLKNRCVKLVSLSQVSNVTGVVHDLTPFVTYAREKGAIFIVDGAQSVSHRKVNLKELGADFYAFSAHKMTGPTGIGVLVGRRSLLELMVPFMGGGDMILEVYKDHASYNAPPHKFEAGTPDIGGVFGLSAAIDYLESTGMERIDQWEKNLLHYTLKNFKQENIKVHGPSLEEIESGVVEKVGVVSFEIDGVHPHDVGTIFDDYNVCIRAGHHCCQLLMQKWNVAATNRASFYMYNNYKDIDRLLEAVVSVRKIFKR